MKIQEEYEEGVGCLEQYGQTAQERSTLKGNRANTITIISRIFVGLAMIFYATNVSRDLSKVSGTKKKRFGWIFILSIFLLGIPYLVEYFLLCRNLGRELQRREIKYNFNGFYFLGLNLIEILIFLLPFGFVLVMPISWILGNVFLTKLCRAMDYISLSYNAE